MTWTTPREELPDTTRAVLVELHNFIDTCYKPVVSAAYYDNQRRWWVLFRYDFTKGWRVRRWTEMPAPTTGKVNE